MHTLCTQGENGDNIIAGATSRLWTHYKVRVRAK